MGATLALAYAVKKNPDKIKSLILIGPGPVKGSNLFILRDNRFSRTTKVDEELIKQWNDSIKKEPGNRKRQTRKSEKYDFNGAYTTVRKRIQFFKELNLE